MEIAAIKQYWDERARQHAASAAATTDDVYLRELEIERLVQRFREMALPEGARVLDVGCGNGYSTLALAERFPDLRFLGVDYSEPMIASCEQELAARPHLRGRAAFRVGDVLDLKHLLEEAGEAPFDAALTDRCLINLPDLPRQAAAVAQIAACLAPGAPYVAIENFVEGHDAMNALRAAVDLPPIPIRWHNRYFTEPEFRDCVAPCFEGLRFDDFSSTYYFATRVIYSAFARMRGEEPDYRHEIHQLAPKLPAFGSFSPIRMAVMQRKGASSP
jgi:SAM-dependent methyltransferase